MEVSIITPCYNSQDFISDTIRSVLQQTFSDWEYIIVDDGSRDGSVSRIEPIVATDARLRLICQENKGVAAARNTGFLAANPSSQYLIFLDNDDIWEPDTLEVLVNQLRAHPDSVAAYGLPQYFGQPPAKFLPPDLKAYSRNRFGLRNGRIVSLARDEPLIFADFSQGNPIVTPGQVLIRRTALETVGLFDPATVPSDDYDMWIRISRIGTISFLDRIVLYWRQHPGNNSHNVEKMSASFRRVRQKTITSKVNNPSQRSVAIFGYRKGLERKIWDKASLARTAVATGEVRTAVKQLTYCLKPALELLKSYAFIRPRGSV